MSDYKYQQDDWKNNSIKAKPMGGDIIAIISKARNDYYVARAWEKGKKRNKDLHLSSG